MKKLLFPVFLFSLLILLPRIDAQIAAGDILVDIDATTHPGNEVLNVITNTGTMGGVFVANGGGATIPETINVGSSNGTRGIRFDGLDFMQHFDAPGGNMLPAPAGIVGTNRTTTIEAWVLNTTIADEETIVGWGKRGAPIGGNMAFNYGFNPSHGAVGHSGVGPDIGWGAIGTPTAGEWHHLVYTYDGTTTRVYADGVLANSEVLGANVIVTQTNTPITLAAQINPNGTVNDGLRGSLIIGRLRIHDGVLSDFEITQNYDLEKADFTLGSIAPLSAGPIHRYRFDLPEGAITSGVIVVDSVGGLDGSVQGNDAFAVPGMLALPGGSFTNAAFVDLPNGILSANSLNNGGSGQITFEGWNVMRGFNTWGRLFDFGSSNAGEINGVGTPSNGLDYFILTAQIGNDVTRKRVEIRDGEPVNTGANILDFESYTPADMPHHYAVTWDESSGVVRIFENGLETASYVTSKQMSDINDINNWLGRGQWSNDLVLKIDLDEFRIYDYTLSPAQVAANAQFGPDVVYLAPGPLQAIRLDVRHTNLFPGTDQSTRVFADYLNVTNLDISTSNISYVASNPGVVDIDANGVIQAIGLGTGTVSAVFSGLTNSVSITVSEPAATLIHRYNFNNDARDSVGSAHGTIINGASNINGRIVLDGALQQYVELPPFIINPTFALTVEAFTDIGPSPNFARLFDFGRQDQALQGRDYVFFSPIASGAIPRAEIFTTGLKDILEPGPGFNLNGATNAHVVTVFHPAARNMQLFINGCLVAERNDVTTSSMSQILDQRNWIGRSLYNVDGYLNAEIEELRIYDGVMPPQQVALGQAIGPDQLPPSDPGNLLTIRAFGATNMILDEAQTLTLFGDFDLATNVNLCAYPLSYSSSDSQIVAVTTNGFITAQRVGTADIQIMLNGVSTNFTITVERFQPLELVHRYPFDGNADDVLGGAHGSLSNQTGNATYTNGVLTLGNDGTQLSSGTTGDYVNLPNGIVSALPSNATFEVWSTWNDGGLHLWERMFDFGRSNGGEDVADAGTGHQYLLLTPNGDVGVETVAYQTQAPGRSERRITSDVRATLGVETHYVISWIGREQKIRLYVNGILKSIGDLHMALSDIDDLNNWLGRSQFGNDRYFVGAYNEFRIYTGAMSSTDVFASFAAGPDAVSTSETMLAIERVPGNMIRLSWPISPTGFVLQSADRATGTFTNSPLSVVVEDEENAAYTPVNSGHKVYRLAK